MNGSGSGVDLEGAQLVLGRRTLGSPNGPFEITFFRDQESGRTAMAIARGSLDERKPLLCRIHSSCVTSECLMACDCDCAVQLERSLAMIAAAGRGVVVYLMQEGRGAGLTAKARDRMLVQASGHRLTTFDAYAEMGLPADLRRYDGVGPMARALGIRGPLELLTNNPEKAEGVARALAKEKIDVLRTRSIAGPTSVFNRDYLRAKRRSGHSIARGAAAIGALPPVSVRVEAARRSIAQPQLISTAQYYLPIALAPGLADATGVDWFRLRVIHDRRTGRESVLLSLGDERAASLDAHQSITLALVDRLPCDAAHGRERLRDLLRKMRDSGRGRVVVHFDDTNPDADRELPRGVDRNLPLSAEILAARWDDAKRSESATGSLPRDLDDVTS